MGFNKEEILIVEDSPIGLESAKSSGAMVLKVNNPHEISRVIEEIDRINGGCNK